MTMPTCAGFAAWMQNFAADAIFPEWSLWEQFIHTDQGYYVITM